MTDPELRSLIEYHAEQLLNLNEEKKVGYGVTPKDKVLEHLARMMQLAKELDL